MTTGLPRLSECRDCADPIRFVRMESTGRALPVDPSPTPRGTVAATLRSGRFYGYIITQDRLGNPAYAYRFVPHHASCEARKTPKKPAPEPHPALF